MTLIYSNIVLIKYFEDAFPDNEVSSVIKFCHFEACGGHFSSRKTTAKILQSGFYWPIDTTKRLMSSPKCKSVEVINNPARPGSNHKEVNCINYK